MIIYNHIIDIAHLASVWGIGKLCGCDGGSGAAGPAVYC